MTSKPIDLVSEAIDIGVIVGQVPDSTFVLRQLGRVTCVLAAAPAYLDEHGRTEDASRSE